MLVEHGEKQSFKETPSLVAGLCEKRPQHAQVALGPEDHLPSGAERRNSGNFAHYGVSQKLKHLVPWLLDCLGTSFRFSK